MKEGLTALGLVQKIGWATYATDCNEGSTLPLEVAKKIAVIAVKELVPASKESMDFMVEITDL